LLREGKRATVLGKRNHRCAIGYFIKQVFEVIGTDGTIASQGRAQYQRSVFSRFLGELELESLLALNVENQYEVTHFKKETFTLYEYAQIFSSSVEEGVKRVTPWSAHYYTHPNSYYAVEPSATGQLVLAETPKPVGERLSRNDEAEIRVWAKQYDKCVRQRSVRKDNTMDRAGTLPLNLYETQTLLNPLDLQFVLPCVQSSVPGESAERPEGKSDEQPAEVLSCNDQSDEYSSSESGDSEKTKTAHQKNERFSSVQVKVCVYPNNVSQAFN